MRFLRSASHNQARNGSSRGLAHAEQGDRQLLVPCCFCCRCRSQAQRLPSPHSTPLSAPLHFCSAKLPQRFRRAATQPHPCSATHTGDCSFTSLIYCTYPVSVYFFGLFLSPRAPLGPVLPFHRSLTTARCPEMACRKGTRDTRSSQNPRDVVSSSLYYLPAACK